MITVLTPTYNRQHTLGRLYESLRSQTSKCFEWLIVDDGSSDDTELLLAEFLSEQSFNVRCIRQDNGGKHVALNAGSQQAAGEWVLIVDSDDTLTEDAIETVLDDIRKIESPQILGYCYRRAYFDGTIIGMNLARKDPMCLHPTKASKVFRGDLAYVFRVEALRSNPFPVFKDERFVPELYIWNKIGDQGQVVFFPDRVIYLSEYLLDGYTANFKSNLQRNPKGFSVFYRDQYFREPGVVEKVKCIIRLFQCYINQLYRTMRK